VRDVHRLNREEFPADLGIFSRTQARIPLNSSESAMGPSLSHRQGEGVFRRGRLLDPSGEFA
jgi:hypothetical protein